MRGRFPPDIFTIIVVPFIAVALGALLPPFLIPKHAHHHFALIFGEIVLCVVVACIAVLVARHRKDKR